MIVCAIVPVRSLADGKRRLAGAMDDAARAALNEAFLVHTLGLAGALSGPTLLVSPDEAVAAHPSAADAVLVADPGLGLNAAVDAGRNAARRRNAGRIVVLPSDLPTARPDDVLALAGTPSPVAVAPDRHRRGTNGLALDAGLDFAFRFGAGSFAAHMAEAARLEVAAEAVDNPRLALDIDTPEDWRDWRGRG
ncbi:MAG: 2-phospho-L-lactate guanylyltransferase [Defluviicoccus sp.]|nr:2-phospho-L-lactate guanylyltransferase [Defluviicoccus sp.]MDE0386474.1 2-phospho-L-lactate guanylyltransferase [Defluviicoccus sp.]